MSNIGKFHDYTPFIKVAGVTETSDGNADQSLRQDLYFKPITQTPENIKKYRRSFKEISGVKQIHPGIYDDPKDYEKLVHGVKTAESDHVNHCIMGRNLSGINHFINNIYENKYSKNQREPLGQSIIRNYKFPEKVKEDEFRFGVPTTGFFSAKDLVYFCPNLNEPEEVKKLYNKTHGLSDPGQQKDRNYRWPVDKDNFVFGKEEIKEFDGTKKSLEFDYLEASYPKSKIVEKRLEDFRQATGDIVGRGKFRGTLNPSIDENFVFGSYKSSNGWNAAKCIHGDPEEKTQRFLDQDPDLGKSLHNRTKLKNLQPNEYDGQRTFGLPSIRYDLKQTRSSICDNINYGNEKDAFDLLYPNPQSVRNLDDADFEEKVDKDLLKSILFKYNHNFPDEEYNLIYEIALKNFPDPDKKVSFRGFLEIMKNLKREHMRYRTLIS